MPAEIGRKTTIGVGIESTKGTGVAPQIFIPVSNFSVDVKSEYVDDNSSYGRIEDSIDSYVAKKKADISFDGNVYDKAMGYLLLAALGQVSSADSGDASGLVYKHTFTVKNDADHPALSLEAEGDNYDERAIYSMLESLSIDAAVGEYLKYSAAFKGKTEESTSGTASYTQENIFLPKMGTFKLADTQAGLDAANAIDIRNAKINITKSVLPEYSLGSETPSALYNQVFTIDGEIELVMDSDTYKDIARDGTQKAMRLDFINSDVTIGTSDNPQLTIDLNLVSFQDWGLNTDIDGIKTQTLGFKAHYKLADSKMVQIELTNLQTAYTAA